LTLSYEILLLVRYDGDSTIGHRLYTEDVTVNFKQNWKGKSGRLTKPDINIHWETVATNLDEFLDISEKLSRKGRTESAIAEHLKAEIIPAVEKLQKKKERDLKRQEKKDKLLAFANSFQTRSLRERRPISYNYSDYDRSIEEAIRAASNYCFLYCRQLQFYKFKRLIVPVCRKAKEHDSREVGTKEKHASHLGDKGTNGRSDINSEHNKGGGGLDDAKYLSDLSSGDEEDRDYIDQDGGSADSDGDNNASDPYRSDLEEEDVFVPRKRTRLAARLLKDKPRQGLRRSQRNVKNDEEAMHPGQLTPPPMTKKTLRQRPTPISKQPDATFSGSEDDRAQVVADSEDESGSEDNLAQVVADSEDESE
ncbi:hypothetical protein BAE44_0006462, partial [Dichanthelium oligosanthes]